MPITLFCDTECIERYNTLKINDFPDYIIDFLKDINTKIEEEEDYDYINKNKTFNKKLNKKLEIYCKKYLGMK